METINLGRVAFVYKGDYSAVTTYNKMDVVFDGESSFVSQIDNNVGNPLVNGLNWKYLSRGNNLELQEAKQDIATLETDLNKNGLIATYIHSSNLEVHATSLDISTGTFTKIGHGLNDGNRISPMLNVGVAGLTAIEVFPSAMPNDSYYVVESSNNTFKISTSLGGVPVVFVENTTMDLTKWHFEKIHNIAFSFSNLLDLTSYNINVVFKSLISSQLYVQTASSNSFTKNSEANPLDVSKEYNATNVPKAYWGILNIYVDLNGIMQYSVTGNCVGYSSQAKKMKITSIDRYVSINIQQTPINSLVLQNFILANGSIIKLYKY